MCGPGRAPRRPVVRGRMTPAQGEGGAPGSTCSRVYRCGNGLEYSSVGTCGQDLYALTRARPVSAGGDGRPCDVGLTVLSSPAGAAL